MDGVPLSVASFRQKEFWRKGLEREGACESIYRWKVGSGLKTGMVLSVAHASNRITGRGLSHKAEKFIMKPCHAAARSAR